MIGTSKLMGRKYLSQSTIIVLKAIQYTFANIILRWKGVR